MNLDELERLEREATPGPWSCREDTFSWWVVRDQEGGDEPVADCETGADAMFLVALRNAAPDLIREVRTLRAEVVRLTEEREEAVRINTNLAHMYAAALADKQRAVAEVTRLTKQRQELVNLREEGASQEDSPHWCNNSEASAWVSGVDHGLQMALDHLTTPQLPTNEEDEALVDTLVDEAIARTRL